MQDFLRVHLCTVQNSNVLFSSGKSQHEKMQGVTGCTSIPARVPGCPADLFANFNVKYAGQAHPVMQLNTKTAS